MGDTQANKTNEKVLVASSLTHVRGRDKCDAANY